MDLQVKKLKVNSLTGPYHHPQGWDKLQIFRVKGEV